MNYHNNKAQNSAHLLKLNYVLCGFLFWLFLCSVEVFAQTEKPTELGSSQTLEARLSALENTLENTALDQIQERIPAYLLETSALERDSKQCEDNHLKKIKGLEDSLAILEGQYTQATSEKQEETENEAPEPEKTTVIPELEAKKEEIKSQKQHIEKELSQCRILLVRAKDLSEKLQAIRTSYVQQHLFYRDTHFIEHVRTLQENPQRIYENSSALYELLKNRIFWDKHLSHLAIVLGLAFILGIGLRLRYRQFIHNKKDCQQCSSALLHATWRYLIIFSPWALSSLAGWLFIYFNQGTPNDVFFQNIFEQVSWAVISLIFLRGLARVQQSNDWISNVGERLFQTLSFWARWVIIFGSIGLLFYHTFMDIGEDNTLFALLRHLLVFTLCLLLARLLWVLVFIQPLLKRLHLRFFGLLLLLLALGAHLAGYRNFSVFLLYGFVGTLMVLTGFAFFYRILDELIESLNIGRAPWQIRWRQHLKLKPDNHFPGVLWIRLTGVFSLLLIVSAMLLYLWGLSNQSLDIIIKHLFNEFSIGGLNLELNKLLLGLLVLVVLLNVSRLLRVQLHDNWLKNTSISESAREASNTLFGYFGVFIAVIIGLSIGGVNLSNLAFIAGALSIGIGFGLQNVVNNFVSGLILLFERPIRRGDWVKINNTEGYVKAIKIRSTIIQTFDRSDIIVPNSELISNQVTNYFFDDRYGRIIVPVGVAYGSDAREVMRILEDCARQHEKITKDHPNYYLKAFCMGFGDSAINFELRCFTYDIDSKLSIKSDLTLLIYEALNDAGIVIPFPQQDVHLYRDT